MTVTKLTLPYSHMRALIVSALNFKESESSRVNVTNSLELLAALDHVQLDRAAERFTWRRHSLSGHQLVEIFANAYEQTARHLEDA